MANLEPIQPAEEPVIVIPEENDETYKNLIKSCTNRFNTYLTIDRPNARRTKISSFFSKSNDFDNANLKELEVKNLNNLIKQWQPSNFESTKKLLLSLSLMADKAQKGVFWPKWIKNSDLLNAINDVKDLIWIYLIQYKPNVKDQLVLNHQQMIADLKNYAITSGPADKSYETSHNINRFENKGKQLAYEIENIYPIGDTARTALYEAQRKTHKVEP